MTEPSRPPRIEDATPDLRAELIERLRDVVPQAFADGKIDFDALKELIGDEADTGAERYRFTWAGKRDAIAMLQAPSNATLAPDHERSLNFEGAQHAFIEGENLEVLKALYRAYYGRVKLVYIDPPYNTGSDFIYPDNFAQPLQNYLRLTGQVDENGVQTSTERDTAGRFHSSWLTMIYPRLALARQMLRDDGFIVVSIDDDELSNLTRVLDETFGEENRVAVLVYDRNRKNDAKLFSVGHEYMVVYARNRAFLKERDTVLRAEKEGVEELREVFKSSRKAHGDDWNKVRDDILAHYETFDEDDPRKPLARFRKVDENGPYRDDGDISWPGGGGPRYQISHPITRKPVKIPKRGWMFPSRRRFIEICAEGRIVFGPDETTIPSIRSNIFDRDVQVMRSVMFSYAQTASNQFADIFGGRKVFDNPKSYTDLERLIVYLSEPGDLVMDFFAGSNTSFHGLLLANAGERVPRRMICVQMAEPIVPRNDNDEAAKNSLAMGMKNISDIAYERIRRVIANDDAIPSETGVRCFRLAPSSIRSWTGVADKDADAYGAQLEAFADMLEDGWTPEAVAWEVALREGYPLTADVARLEQDGQVFWRVSDPDRAVSFHLCLDAALTLDAVRAVGLSAGDLFVCRDTALDDTLAANLALQCRLKVL